MDYIGFMIEAQKESVEEADLAELSRFIAPHAFFLTGAPSTPGVFNARLDFER